MIKKIRIACTIILFVAFSASIFAENPVHEFYLLKIYHLKNNEQIAATDDYLKSVYTPALHRLGFKNIGVFKPIANDTSSVKFIYVLIPFASAGEWMKLDVELAKDDVYASSAKVFLEAPANKAPYERMESVVMEAFSGQKQMLLPTTKNADRIFELRSYESPTENLSAKKIAMFNKDEIDIFKRLGFNPVFYGRVVSGNHMPNFMYMPIFDNVAARDAQWKVFGNDAKWKEISNDPVNENKVSVNHIDSILMQAASYSDY
jgi:hypothetical protein